MPTPATAYLQLDPDHDGILDDMISFAEERHAAPRDERRRLSIAIHDPFHDLFGRRLAARGYTPSTAEPEWLSEWATAETYRELQRAPDYRRDLDLYVAAPDGALAACCIAWHDQVNRVGTFTPVGTHPAYRRMGLGRAVIMEGIDRLAALGATKAWVGSGQPFYAAIGFTKKYKEIVWQKEF